MSAGPCEASIRKWFYDKNTDTCSQFAYGGCEGNGNRYVKFNTYQNVSCFI